VIPPSRVNFRRSAKTFLDDIKVILSDKGKGKKGKAGYVW
jgi:hypothetical protein